MTVVDWVLVGVGAGAVTVGVGCLVGAMVMVWRAADDHDPKGLR